MAWLCNCSMTARSSSGVQLFAALSWLYPLLLLTTALTRLILPSFFYLFSFFYFILFPPLTLRPSPQPPSSSASSHPSPSPGHQPTPLARSHVLPFHYTFHPLYFLVHIVVPAVFLFSHLLSFLVFHFSSLTPSPLLSFLGLSPLTSLPSALLLLLPDFLFLLTSLPTFLFLQHQPSPPPSTLLDIDLHHSLWDTTAFFLLLASGILYISLVALPYFLLFIALILHLSFQSYRYRHGHITSMPLSSSSSSSPFLSSSSFHLTSLSASITSFLPTYAPRLLVFFSYYLPLHLTLLFAYQFLSLDDVAADYWRPSRFTVNLVGAYTPTDIGWFAPKWTAYLGTAMHVGLLAACGERRNRERWRSERRRRRRAHRQAQLEQLHADEQVEEEEEEGEEDGGEVEDEEGEGGEADGAVHDAVHRSAADGDGTGQGKAQFGSILGDLTVTLLSEERKAAHSAPPPTPAASRRSVSPASLGRSPATHSGLPSSTRHSHSQSRSIALRHFLLRLSRYSGRFLCSLLLGITIFTLPSLLAILLLILLVASLLTSSSLFTRLAPYYLFFLLFTSLVLYVFSIPLLFPEIPALQIIGLSHTHLPFVYVLDYIAPILAFSAFLITYRLSLASLTEESILIAVSSGDEEMVRAAMRQSPPILITQAKDERGRTLLHLAARYGQLPLILPLCRYLDVNAQDSDGKTPLHLAFYHGYDRIVKVLLFHPLIEADRTDRFGQRALEQERSTSVRLLVALRQAWDAVSEVFVGNADLLSLLLLYFVSTVNLDGIHLVYFAFFLFFFTFPSMAQRYWAVLVVYCACILILLFSYSVLYSQFADDVEGSAEVRSWLALIGLFETDAYFVDLALYYTVFIVVLVQWYVFERKEGRKRERREEREKERERRGSAAMSRIPSFAATPAALALSASSSTPSPSFGFTSSSSPSSSFPFPPSSGSSSDLSPSNLSLYLPVYRASAIGLATVTLVVVALSSSSSLFYFGYLLLFTLSLLALALVPRQHRLLLAFYTLSTLYSFLVLTLEYLYLAHALHRLSPLYTPILSTLNLTSPVIGFRPRTDTHITWTLFPLTAVFVTQVIQLRAQLLAVRLDAAQRRAQVEEEEEEREGEADAEGQAEGQGQDGNDPLLFQTPQRPSPPQRDGHPPASPRSPLGITIDKDASGRSSSAATPRSAPSGDRRLSAAPSPWAASTPRWSRRRRRWSVAIEEAVSQHEREVQPSALLLLLSFLYSTLFSLLDAHAHHLLAVLVILVIACVDAVSVASLVFLGLLLLLCPFHQSYFLFVPTLIYAPLLLLTRYLYQLPPFLSALSPHSSFLTYLGLIDYHGALAIGLYGDVLITFVAAVQQMVGKERRRLLTQQAVKQAAEAKGADEGEKQAEVDRLEEKQAPLEFAAKPGDDGGQAQLLKHPGKLASSLIDDRHDDTKEEQTTHDPTPPDHPSLPPQKALGHASSSPSTLSASGADGSWSLSDWWMFATSLLFNLLSRFSRFASTFLARYTVQLTLLFVLLTAAYRNNVVSLIYLLPIAGYIARGRPLLYSLWRLFLIFVALTIVWQYLVLLSLPPSITLTPPLAGASSGLRRWLLLGSFEVSSLSFDLLTYFFLCLELAYIGKRGEAAEEETRERERRERWERLGFAQPGDDSSPQVVIRSEEDYREWQEKEDAREAEKPDDPHDDIPATPSSSFASSSFSHLPASSLSKHRVMDRRAALVWPTLTFYLVRTMDKLFFVFVFAAATAHLDLLSLPFLFASLYLLFSNQLYTGDRSGLTRFYSALHWYNFVVLALYIAYQVPVLCPSFSERSLQWEALIGLRKYVCDCDPTYCVPALSFDGALSPLLIFFLIDLQLLVLSSPLYRRIESYYASVRSMSVLRSSASTLHTQEQNRSRIVSILALRDRITRSFTSVFLLAAQLNPQYFEDETVWSTEKPQGWDEAVDRDLREQKKQDKAAREEEQEREGAAADQWDDDDDAREEAEQAGQVREIQREKEKLMRQSVTRESRHEQKPDEGALHYYKRLARRWLIHRIDFTLYTSYATKEDPTSAPPHPAPSSSSSSTFSPPSPSSPAKPEARDVIPLTHVDPRHLSTLTLFFRFLVTQSQYVVFAAYFLTLLVHPSLVSSIVPFFIFTYALFEFPRAPSFFFVLCFCYSLLVIACKFVFQLPVFCVRVEDRQYILAPSPLCETGGEDASAHYQSDYLIGITKAHSAFFFFVLPELLCVLCIVWHREVSLQRGVWGRKEKEEDTVHPEVLGLLERYEAAHQNPLSHTTSTEDTSSSPPLPQPNVHASQRLHSVLLSAQLRLLYVLSFLPSSIQAYFARLIPAQRLHGIYISKPGSDFFLFLFFIELICATLILFDWSNMAATTSTSVSSFTTNLFSAQMVAVLFVQTLIIVAERMIYTFRSILAKIVLQYFTATLWLSLVLFAWPQWSESGVQDNPSLQVFLLLKLAYLFFSGLQIFHGFPPVEVTGMQDLIRHPGKYLVQVYKVYRAIPFVFELRTILDWMCTRSSLDLDETFKLEDIYTRLYLVQCALISRKEHKRGDSRPWDEKLLNGVLLFSLLLLIIFAPLLLFSSANPVTVANPVTGAAIELTLSGPRGEWTLFTISSFNATLTLSDDLAAYAALRDARLVDSNDHPDDIQQLQMTNFSDSLWSISPPALSTLTRELFAPGNDSFAALLEFTFTRPLPATTPTISLVIRVPLTDEKRVELGEFIETRHERSNITLERIVPLYWRLPAAAAPIEIADVGSRMHLTLAVVNDNATQTRYFQAYVPIDDYGSAVPLCDPKLTVNVTSPPSCNAAFVVISTRVFGGVFSSFSFSIVSLYSLILFTFGQFIRLLFSNLVARIPYEDIQNADRLLALVEAVYVARWKQEMRMEEILYRRLIKIMRTAPLLIELTKRDTQGEEQQHNRERQQQEAQQEHKEAEEEKQRGEELQAKSRQLRQEAEGAPKTAGERKEEAQESEGDDGVEALHEEAVDDRDASSTSQQQRTGLRRR